MGLWKGLKELMCVKCSKQCLGGGEPYLNASYIFTALCLDHIVFISTELLWPMAHSIH